MLLFYLVYVRSDINLGNRNHVRHAIVQAEIVRRNIPVSNGVVHLIGKPLVKTASDLWGFLKQEVGPISFSNVVLSLLFNGIFISINSVANTFTCHFETWVLII